MTFRFTLALLLLLLAALSVTGCDTGNGTPVDLGDFTANLTDFEPHVGQTLYLKVKEAATGETVATLTPMEVTTADFELSIPNVIEQGVIYNVDYWVDMDDNGTADRSPIGTPAGVDHTWRKVLTGTATGINLNYAHDTDFTDITPF